MPLTMSATLLDSLCLRLLAEAFGTKPVSSTTFMIFSRVAGLISGCPVMARDTVLTPTPHIFAMSLIVVAIS